MNRAQKRKAGIQFKDPTFNLKQSDIDRIKKQATDDAIDQAFIIMLTLPMLVLRDKWGFGKTRTQRFMDQTLEAYEDFRDGRYTFEDLLVMLKEEVELTFEFEKHK